MAITGSSRQTRGNALFGGVTVTGPVDLRGSVKGTVNVDSVAIGALTTGEKDTALVLPTVGLVIDAWVRITTVETSATTKTIDVGLKSGEAGGDADGFLDGVSTATPAGVKRGVATLTAGGNETYFASTTRGVLLSSILAGTDVAGDVGTYYEFPHILNGTAKTVTYTLGSQHTQLAGRIYVAYIDLT